jgi:hypothetical protein
MVQRSAEWQPSTVGTASYARSTATGASMTVEFVGTELFLTGILSPDGGRISVWVDADSSGGNTQPFSIASLAADQARDDAIPLVSDLPAAQHRLTIVVEGGEVTVSGFFAAGKAEPGTTSALVAIGLFAIAVVALADICYASVTELRNRALAPDRSVSAQDHPREFTHRR